MNTITPHHLKYAARITVYAIAALLPIWFVPLSIGIDVGRQVTFGILIMLATILWLLSFLLSGEIRYRHSAALYGALLFAAVAGASTLLSKTPYASLFFSDTAAERLATLALGALLLVVVGGVCARKGEGGTILFILTLMGGIGALGTMLQLVFGFSLFQALGVQGAADVNVVGTINGLSLFYASLLMIVVGLLLAARPPMWKAWVRVVLGVEGILLLSNLILINFRTAWIIVLGSAVFLFGVVLMRAHMNKQGGVRGLEWRYWAVLGLIVLSIAMIILPREFTTPFGLPAEVSPSLSATIGIARSVFGEGTQRILLGSGPTTFGLDWARYKDLVINQTIFWGVRFEQGYSWVATIIPTLGVVGLAAFLFFAASLLIPALRALLSPKKDEEDGEGKKQSPNDALFLGAFLGVAALLIAAFVYPANLSFVLLLFLLAGTLVVLFDRGATRQVSGDDLESRGQESFLNGGEAGSAAFVSMWTWAWFWEVAGRAIRIRTPWAMFFSSLAAVFILAVGLAGMWAEISHLRARYEFERGATMLVQGALDPALDYLARAEQIEPRNTRYIKGLVEARIGEVRRLLERAAGGEDVQQEFQKKLSVAIEDSQRATTLNPEDSVAWRLQGALYELIIPFVAGSEQFATAAYQRATELEPSNPAIYADWGRAGLVFTDRMVALSDQFQGKDKEQLGEARRQTLEQVVQIFQRAIQVKADFAPAHFLLAQTAIRLGNVDAAIQSVENAKLVAPSDIGIAFQLGLLYYQKGDFDRAQTEFERAVVINENYSNARYFLGLIYDRKGDTDKAINEFERIERLNPGNQEVLRIINNLKKGGSALEGIAPPAPPPEQRKETPIREQEGGR